MSHAFCSALFAMMLCIIGYDPMPCIRPVLASKVATVTSSIRRLVDVVRFASSLCLLLFYVCRASTDTVIERLQTGTSLMGRKNF
jgi:hypothetical protein